MFSWFRKRQQSAPRRQPAPTRSMSIREFAADNEDIVAGWRLCATLDTKTPRAWLLRHGEFHPGVNPPSERVPPEFVMWMPVTKTWAELGLDLPESPPMTMASQFGPVPGDGGDALRFLRAYREILESNGADEVKAALQSIEAKFPGYHDALGGDLVQHWQRQTKTKDRKRRRAGSEAS